MKTLSLTLLIATTITMTSAPSQARSSDNVHFRYNASELNTEQGRETLLKRMKTTARSACGNGIASHYNANACQAGIEKQFVKAIGNNALLARYERQSSKTGQNG